MKRIVAILTAVVLIAGGVVIWSSFGGGCHRTPKTRIATRQTFDSPTTLPASTEDWPRWRGPRGDGISRETGLASAWPEDGPRQLWSAEVGVGFASPVATNGVVYLFTLNEGAETLTAFDAASGNILWNSTDPAGWDRKYPGTRATPVIEGDRVYTFGARGNLIARDTVSGEQYWKMNVLQHNSAKNLDWGSASTPLLHGDLIYVQSGAGSAIATAVRKQDGTIVWTSAAKGIAGYAHPILADVAGTMQLIVFGGDNIYGLDPDSGKTLWSYPWNTDWNVNGSTPVYQDGHLFITSAYDKGSLMLRLSADGAEKVWTNGDIQSRFQGAILDRDALYLNSEGTLHCLSWPDGAVHWKATDRALRLGIGGSMVRVGDRLILMSERGKLSLIDAEPSGYKLISQADAVEGRYVWATPLVYGGRLYAKGDQEFICFDISNGGKAAE